MNTDNPYAQASIKTADNLRTIAQSQLLRDVSRLSLPEVDEVVNAVARVVPAGNVPGVILNGLARLPERRPPANLIKRDIHLLFQGVEGFLDQALFGAAFAGPAAVLWGYQNLLKLAGKDPEAAFPQGTWQFYVDYALRDDTARHTNETHGFDTALKAHNLRLSPADRLAAWMMAAITALHQYPALLANEWRERVHTALLKEVTAGTPAAVMGARAYRDWENRRPYGRGADAGTLDYPAYRRARFEDYLGELTRNLALPLRAEWQRRIQEQERESLPAYQLQMSILAYLDPGPYGETRIPFRLSEARLGVVHHGAYYLLPVCAENARSETVPDPAFVRDQAAAVLTAANLQSDGPADPLQPLALVRRSSLAGLRGRFELVNRVGLDALRFAPILIDAAHAATPPVDPDVKRYTQPLARLRQAERGVGDHPLTIHDTGRTFLFDQSHIFFDGGWGAALAEILTNEALAWAVYYSRTPVSRKAANLPAAARIYTPRFSRTEQQLIRSAPCVTPEAAAENCAVNLKTIAALRKLFKRRNDLLGLTVNDLLILYRALHAAKYWPSETLLEELQDLEKGPPGAAAKAAEAALDAIARTPINNPAVLIPVDASGRSPRDRLYPLNFEVPLRELDLIALHCSTLSALDAYQQGPGERGAVYQSFDALQRRYLAVLAGFGEVLGKAREIALSGQAASAGTLKMLANLPAPLQRMLEAIPGRFDLLNDLIKGREVFSNVGAVAPSSTLVRFITAKDDNDKKTLAWGVLTDAAGVMHISLRDFRPHVGLLQAAGRLDLADRITQDYLDAYTSGLNGYTKELMRITQASRETRLMQIGS